MLKNIIYRLLERRHFWRYASFSEIAELYMSRTLRVIAISIVAGFASVYMYEIGYSVIEIMLFWACFFVLKFPFNIIAAYITARIGPKHGTLLSNILAIPAMVALGFAPVWGLSALVVWGVLMAMSSSIYQLSYLVDFSKVKSADHAGKELAFMNILEKVAIGVSPLIGGIIALFFGPSVIMWAAAAFYMTAALPLLMSMEPVRTHQKLEFRHFPWRTIRGTILSRIGVGFDAIATGHAWTLFIAIAIFPAAGNGVYVTLGALSSVTIIAAITASYTYGKLIDRRRGGQLLRISVVANALVHASRPFVGTPVAIVGTNITNEVTTMGYSMAYTRGMFSTADESGHRIIYLSLTEILSNLAASIACLVLAVSVWVLGEPDGLRLFFLVSAVAVLLIGTARFGIYRK